MVTQLLARCVPLALLALTLCCSVAFASDEERTAQIRTSDLPALPAQESEIVGISTLDGRPFVLQRSGAWILNSERTQWTRLDWPQGDLASRIRALTSDYQRTFLFLGGSEVAALSLDGDRLSVEELPALPVTLSSAVIATREGVLHVAGVDASGASVLLTSQQGSWNEHPGWPGGGTPTSIAVQNSGEYVTVEDGDPAKYRLLRRNQDGWQERSVLEGELVRGSARAIGQAHILYLVRRGDGVSELASYHVISSSWATLPYRAEGDRAVAGSYGTGIVSARANGAGVALQTAELTSSKRGLSWIDWVIVVVYLGGMVGVGMYFYMRAKRGSTDDFFLGNRAIPFWVAGASLYATNTSSISYVAIPAKAFETDWQYMMSKLMTILGLMFVAVWIVPLLRRLDLVSVFNYLEMRFHPFIRMLASALCMMMHVGGRMSIVLFLPALAIATITGVDVVWSILIMGVCTIIYTAMGGMKAVVWTDFVQVIVLMGGALFAILFVLYAIGPTEVFQIAAANDKMKLFNFSFDLTEPTVWGFLVLILLDTVLTFPKDQVLMQRTLATSDAKSAGRSIWVFAAITVPGALIFYGIGTVLFAYYQRHPERLDPLLPIDATFPLFIASELPPGLVGLIIAGIFAAAMGTTSSTINSVATLLSVDFYEKLRRNVTQAQSVRFAEWMSVVVGLIGIGLALVLSRYDIHSLLDLTIELAGLLGGGFAGAYTLGMFTRRANAAGVSIGVATAIIVTLIAWWNDLVHSYFYLGISIFTCIFVGYVASLAFPPPTRSLAGLTIFRDK
jgi:SSS family solute:Na+ symporter